MSRIDPAAKARAALAALGRVLSEAGLLDESVSEDAGEDVLARVRLSEAAEPFRLRVHLTYRSSRRSKERRDAAIRLDREQVWRWAGHIDPVLLCVHDADTGDLFLVDVKQKWSLWQLACDERSALSVTLSTGELATPEAARRLVWRARLHYHATMLAIYENAAHFAPQPKRDGRDAIGIALAFLRDVGIAGEEGVDAGFADAVRTSARHLSARYPDLTLRHAVMLSLVDRMQDDSGVLQTLPRNLLDGGADLAAYLLRTERPADWDALVALYRRGGRPAGDGGEPVGAAAPVAPVALDAPS